MNDNDNQTPATPSGPLDTGDGRKVISFSVGGESYGIETTEQAEKGKIAEAEAELAQIKLQAVKRGIRRVKI